MTKRILYILLGTLVILALTVGLWFWFFNRGSDANSPSNLFGSSDDKNSTTTGGAGSGGNNQAPIGSTAGSGVNGGGTGTGGASNGGVNNQTPIDNNTGPITENDIPFVNLVDSTTISPDIIWNSSLNGNGGVVFNPSSFTALNTGEVTGGPYIPSAIGADGNKIGLGTSLAVVIGGCIATYEAQRLLVKPVAIANNIIDGAVSGAVSFIAGLFGGNIAGTNPLTPSYTYETNETDATTGNIGQCLVRTLGKMAVQQITNSTVNWINSGFDGKPAYVQDYNKFFSGVADQAAGAYLQSTGFAFLCSPFKLQVRIAIAQSYARRSNAPSCTLTSAVNNVNGFINGNFSDGGWQNLIAFTTQSGNNPFAAYMELQGNFTQAQQQAVANANQEINNGLGFLSYKKCTPKPAVPGEPIPIGPAGLNCQIVTPGRAIVGAFDATTQSTLDSLQIGESIDQIFGALANSLITKLLYGGLANVNKNSTATNAASPAQIAATNLMNEMRAVVTSAQEYGSIEQRIITDIQNTQGNLAELQNCWKGKNATTEADAAMAKIVELQNLVTLHDKNIQKANASISTIQELQTSLLIASLPADVTSVKASWDSMKAGDVPHIYDSNDITSSQQDRASIQSNLNTINLDTSTKLQQCYAG